LVGNRCRNAAPHCITRIKYQGCMFLCQFFDTEPIASWSTVARTFKVTRTKIIFFHIKIFYLNKLLRCTIKILKIKLPKKTMVISRYRPFYNNTRVANRGSGTRIACPGGDASTTEPVEITYIYYSLPHKFTVHSFFFAHAEFGENVVKIQFTTYLYTVVFRDVKLYNYSKLYSHNVLTILWVLKKVGKLINNLIYTTI